MAIAVIFTKVADSENRQQGKSLKGSPTDQCLHEDWQLSKLFINYVRNAHHTAKGLFPHSYIYLVQSETS